MHHITYADFHKIKTAMIDEFQAIGTVNQNACNTVTYSNQYKVQTAMNNESS